MMWIYMAKKMKKREKKKERIARKGIYLDGMT